MASEIQATYTTGNTLYSQVRNSVGQIWNTVGSVFQAYATVNITDYDVAMTEQGTASGFYAGAFPVGITTPGVYTVTTYRRAGGTPAETDLVLAAGNIDWSGSAVLVPGTLTATGLDAISVADPGAAASITTWPKAMTWLFRRFFKKSVSNQGDNTIKTYADDGTTVRTTQTVTKADGTTTVGAAE